MPKISVIIPTYNRAGFLTDSVSSVLAQTFKDFELIISDDASTDNTKVYVESLSDPRVIYICSKTNQGVANTRNKAFNISRGEYIAFLDDDDTWFPEKLEKQIRIIENSPDKARGVYTGVIKVDLDSNKATSISVPKYRGNILNELLTENFILTSSVLIDKKCFDKVGLFDPDIPYGEDFDMWIRIAQEFEFDYIAEPLVTYNIHEVRITTNYDTVIRGLELLMTKHNNLFTANKKAYSSYQLILGEFLCLNGNTLKGRNTLIEAIKLYPFNIKHYYNLALSALGSRTFAKTKLFRSKLKRGLIKNKYPITKT